MFGNQGLSLNKTTPGTSNLSFGQQSTTPSNGIGGLFNNMNNSSNPQTNLFNSSTPNLTFGSYNQNPSSLTSHSNTPNLGTNTLFGNTNTQSNNLFGGSNSTLFGTGIGSSNQVNSNTPNMFGLNNQTLLGGNTSNSLTNNQNQLFQHNQTPVGSQLTGIQGLGNIGGVNNALIAPQHINQSQQQNVQLNHLNYSIQGNNTLKYEKLNNILDNNQKNTVFNIEQTINNNELILENNEGHLNDLEDTNKILSQECANLVKMSKFLISTQKSCKLIVEGLERDFKEQISQLHKVKKNFSLIENNSSVKINCPSEYFETILKEMNIKVDSIYNRLSELESLVSTTETDDSGFSSKEEAIQATIMAAHQFLTNYQEESKKINDLVKQVKIKYFETMLAYGFSENDIENRIKRHLEGKGTIV